jgi:glycosyltransferase involved in cell wall biosynthesis
MDKDIEISVVVPIYNEEDNIQPLLEKVNEALVGRSFELILVDDGSRDKTPERVIQFGGPEVKLLVLNRNYGQTTAMTAGIDAAVGKYIVTMDGDLQNDPSDIVAMVEKLEKEGWDVVAGRRANRKDGMFLRKIPSKIANAMIRKLTGVHIHDYGCTLKLFKREVAKNLGMYGQLHRFIPVLANIHGAKITEMDVKHHPRIHGTSKYGLNRTLKVVSDLALILFLQKYLQRPIHLFGPVGFLCLALGLGTSGYLLVVKLLGNDIGGRPLINLSMILLLGGIQLLSMGLVAEMLTRTYFESQNKTTYVVKETHLGKQQA